MQPISRTPYGISQPAPQPRTTFPTRTQPAAIEAPTTPATTSEPSALRPPKGTDPELWKVLTADERAFFARDEAMGPLSYGTRIAQNPAMPARGGRLNLRG
jgi:hypothetical protein